MEQQRIVKESRPRTDLIKMNKRKARYENIELLMLTIPALVYFFIFHYLPMGGVLIAFKDYRYDKGIFGSEWCGFDNFKFFFTSQDALRITKNTICYSGSFIIIGIICAVIVALLLYEIKNKAAIKVYQTTMILPRFLSWVIVGYITYILFNPSLGIFNQIREVFGADKIQWYAEPKRWPAILIFTNLWKTIGMNCLMYYAALMGIDKSLYEAAEIDGANRWQQILHISIPSIKSLMIVLALLALGNLFRGDFGLFYQIPRDVGILYSTTDVIDTYVYRGLRTGDMAITSAVGLFQSLVGLVLVVTANWIIRKIDPESALY